VAIEVASFVYPLDPGSCRMDALEGTVQSVRALTHDISAIEVVLDAPCEFDAGSSWRSAPRRARHARLLDGEFRPAGARAGIHRQEESRRRLFGWLFSGKAPGARLDLFGPLGKATFYPDLTRNILCIAGGTGIAGMMSILSRACRARYFDRYQGHVFFGVRTMQDTFYLDAARVVRRRVSREPCDHHRPRRTRTCRLGRAVVPHAPLRARFRARGGEG
jgi:toluene monooxygenase electron transfer component